MRNRMTRTDVLRKCVVLFDALKRWSSKGNAGLVAEKGMDYAFDMNTECCEILREMLREYESGGVQIVRDESIRDEYRQETGGGADPGLKNWQLQIMKNGGPAERMEF